MAITLETLASGDTNYISKHNNNNTVIKAAVDALQTGQGSISGSIVNFPAFANAMLGSGVGRFSRTGVAGTDAAPLLGIAAGTVWVGSATQARTTVSTSLDFAGQAAATYYTHIDSVGGWSFNTTLADAVHTIVWSGTAFTSITDPAVLFGFGEQPLIVSSFKNTAPTASERVLGFSCPGGVSGITLAAGATHSSCEAETAADAQADFSLTKNGSSIGTIRWAAAGTVATYVSVVASTFIAGDLIEIIAPSSPDADLENIYFTLYLTRDSM